jgi:hypothetical protein
MVKEADMPNKELFETVRNLAEYVANVDFQYGANRKGAKSLAQKVLAQLAKAES